MLAVGPAFAQTAGSDSLRKLQEENAALRRRLAELEGAKAQPAPQPAAAQPASAPVADRPSMAAEPTDKDVLVLSPFQVKQDKDYGYLKTNSATATRIGTEIQQVPLNISVISEDFIKDTNMRDIQDVLRYTASTAGDTKMGILQPATGFTPSGNMSMRGFPINSRLRNGLIRYNAYNLDNVERVELIKGPAAIFFGNAYPGGVINYITKQASFSKIPTSITYSYGGYDTRIGTERVTLDHNSVLSDKAALRITGAWDHALGDARFEFQNGYSVNANMAFVPLKSGKLKIAVEGEVLRRQRNQDDFSWLYPQGWFDAYKNPSQALMNAAGAAITGAADPVAAYRARILGSIGNWIADVRNAAGDPFGAKTALWTAPMQHGAYITDRAGNRYLDKKFNYYGDGSASDEENSTFAITTDLAATSWLDVRHSYTSVQSRFNRAYGAAIPLADGIRFNRLGQVGATLQGYDIDAYYHQLDLVFKKKLANIDNKLLVGGFYGKTYNSFTGSVAGNLFPYYGNLPGNFDKPDEGYVSPTNPAIRVPATNAGARYDLQYVRDRNGKILTPQEIFSLYDPGVHVNPDVTRITQVDRALIDHSMPTRKEWYVNWQGTAMDDRLVGFVGYRKEQTSTVGQILETNPPWFSVPYFALNNIPSDQWGIYGLNPVFARARKTEGDSKMAGLSFALKKNINIYASYSETFTPSGVQFLGGDTNPDDVKARATLLGLDPNVEYARVLADGFFTEVQNERGKNMELGVKVSLNDNKLVGTLSVFRVRRGNIRVDNTQKQFDEKLNYLPGGGASRVIRWFSASATQETEGVEFDGVWTPMRNWQAVISGSWMWTARTVSDPSLTTITPATPQSTIVARDIVFGNRIPFAPEYRFNVFNKYTFDHDLVGDFGRGVSLGLGARYASEIIIGNDVNFNAANGGLTAGNYLVFQTNVSVPFEVLGYKMSATLNVDNVTNKNYSEGGSNLSPPRSYMFTLGMKF
jgi:outer membrane receptor protein involved in Fe transport